MDSGEREGEDKMSVVGYTQIHHDTVDSMKQAIADNLQLIEYSFMKKAKSVVIKPNLCYYWDRSTGQTTDVRFVTALIELIRENIPSKLSISIVEADASAMKCNHAFRMLGYEKLSQEYGVQLVNLSKERSHRISVSVAGGNFSFLVPEVIQQADLKINVPKIKYTPRQTKITCAMKNIYGCNPYPKKFKYHPRLDEVIVALNKVMPFDLCIIDGNIVSGSKPRRLGLVMTSTDHVAIDAAAAKIAGINPNKLAYLKLAAKEGLGNISFSPKGSSPNYFMERYPRETAKEKLIARAFSLLVLARLDNRLGLG